MVTPKIVAAGSIAIRILNAFGFDAIVSPWRTIYIRAEYIEDERLRRHEIAHLAQMDRDGWATFWVRICLNYVWRGYGASPYEIEAKAAERHATHPLLKGYEC